MKKIRIGTRGSPLALVQTKMAIAAIEKAYPGFDHEVITIDTKGDQTQAANISLQKLGGKGLFASALRQELEARNVDILVHSMKDLPSIQSAEYTIAAMLERGDPRDSFLCNLPGITRIEDLPVGAIIGTSSPRRAAIALRRRPDLQAVNFRGNVQTRIEKLNDKFEGVVATFLARVGMERLGLGNVPQTILEIDDVLPPAGQGAIGIEVLSDNKELIAYLQNVGCRKTYRCVMAERACLALLDGDCKTSIAAYATEKDGKIEMKAEILTSNGEDIRSTQVAGSSEEYAALGTKAGQDILVSIDEKDYGRFSILAPG
jgi:hydroxymethylbilane synthase